MVKRRRLCGGDTPPAHDPRRSVMHTLQWVGVCVIGVTAVTLLAAHAPARIRLLGLFAVAVGALCGWGMARGAEWLRVTMSPGRSAILAGVVIATAQVGLTLESWRLFTAAKHHEYLEAPKKEIPGFLVEAAMKERRLIFERETRFPTYLEHRVKNLGVSSSPWPLLLWIGEMILGTAAGIAVFVMTRRASR